MPRDLSGVYTLPVGNPVVTGALIESVWANTTMSDIAAQLNNVMTRDGVLGPSSPFKIPDGTQFLPGLAFNSEPSLGLYRPLSGVLSIASQGIEVARIGYSGLRIKGAASTAPSGAAYSATPAFDAQLSNVFYLGAMTGNVAFTITGPQDGQTINIRFVQDATGGRTVTPPANVKASGTIDATAGRASWLILTYVASATRWEGAWSWVGA